MAGRDLKKLVHEHRRNLSAGSFNHSKTKDDLLNVYISGSQRQRGYTDVDYDTLFKNIQKEKEVGKTRHDKMKRLVTKAKRNKEQDMIEEHRKAWRKMYNLLGVQLINIQHQIEVWKTNVTLDSTLNMREVLSELLLTEHELLKERRDKFQQEMMRPIRLLRREIRELKTKGLTGGKDPPTSFKNEIIREILRIKEEHRKVEKLLEEEWSSLQHEIEPFNDLCTINKITEFKGGVPVEVWSADCPSEDLRRAMMEEFVCLDRHFEEQLTRLRDQYERSVSFSDGEKWNEKDRLHFDLILRQYPPGTPNRRAFYIDRMIREIPHKTRNDIVNYESQFQSLEYYSNQSETLFKSWKTAHIDLYDRVRFIYHEACEEWKRRVFLDAEKDKQRQLCRELTEKVAKWREECLTLQQAEADRVAIYLSEQEGILKEEEIKQMEKKKKIKKQLEEYHVEKEQKRESENLLQSHLVEEARMIKEEQNSEGKKRVQYRDLLYKTRQEELVIQAQEMEEELREKERRLEALRSLVRVEATVDPQRVLKETKASKARFLSIEDCEVQLQQPLFNMYSFTSDKIMSDKRLRVASALRKAGLLSTDYAKKVLSSIPPPHPPRPDQCSSLFK